MNPAAGVVALERSQHSDRDLLGREETQAMGDAWLQAGTSCVARVPAAVAPFTWNYLLNPAHPDVDRIRIASKRRLPFDPRLFRIGR